MKYYDRLEESITDTLVEEQVKLGYYPNAVSLYYPVKSIYEMLEVSKKDVQADVLKQRLEGFCDYVATRLGRLVVQNLGERYRFVIPVTGVAYVHEHCGKQEFLSQLIALMSRHDITREDIESLFWKYSEDAKVKDVDGEEFDFIVFSQTHIPDKYIYCFKQEGHHMVYHRFTEADYEQFGYTLE